MEDSSLFQENYSGVSLPTIEDVLDKRLNEELHSPWMNVHNTTVTQPKPYNDYETQIIQQYGITPITITHLNNSNVGEECQLISRDAFEKILQRLQLAEDYMAKMEDIPFSNKPIPVKSLGKKHNIDLAKGGYGNVTYIKPPAEPYGVMRMKQNTVDTVICCPPTFNPPESHTQFMERLNCYPRRNSKQMNLGPIQSDGIEYSDDDETYEADNTFYTNGGSIAGSRPASFIMQCRKYTMAYEGKPTKDFEAIHTKYSHAYVKERVHRLKGYQVKTLQELLPELLIEPNDTE